MKQKSIYLAGNITKDIRTFQWREEFTTKFNELDPDSDFAIVNPASTEFDKQLQNQDFTTTYESLKAKCSYSQNLFRVKDFQLIKNIDIVVVNLQIIDSERPLVGTIQELGWCRDIFYKPVIGIVCENVYCKHPWIKECLSAEVGCIDDSIQLIFDFFR